jgi:drug/metabolite transporter (DMT)-like permease
LIASTIPSRPAASNPRGILFINLAVLLFSAMDVLIKLATETYAVNQIVFFRSAVAFIPLIFFIHRAGGLEVLRTRRPWAHLWRSGCGVLAMVCFFASFDLLPLGEAVALGQAGPIFLTALSVPLLGEHVGIRRWTAVGVGFIGVLIMTRPGSGLFDPAALLALGGAALYALAMISIRALSATERPATIVFYYTLTATLLGAASLPFEWRTPDLQGLVLLTAIGLLGGVAQMALTQAFRLAAVAVVAPFEYSGLVFAVAAGFLVWGDFPDVYVLTGAGVVVSSGLYILHRETILARTRQKDRGDQVSRPRNSS